MKTHIIRKFEKLGVAFCKLLENIDIRISVHGITNDKATKKQEGENIL
jgi:hypothetical protein